jgi:NADP-dependent 3-hydroxy acid dehydrogenase YdfG
MMTYRANPGDGVAWITGASSGIGRGAALELARRGYRVYATARRKAELEALGDEAVGLKGSIVATPGDVTDRDQMAELVAEIERDWPITLALLNAGGNFWDAAGDIGGDGFAKTMALNLQGVVNGLNPVFNAMRERRRGRIALSRRSPDIAGCPTAAPTGQARPLSFRWPKE